MESRDHPPPRPSVTPRPSDLPAEKLVSNGNTTIIHGPESPTAYDVPAPHEAVGKRARRESLGQMMTGGVPLQSMMAFDAEAVGVPADPALVALAEERNALAAHKALDEETADKATWKASENRLSTAFWAIAEAAPTTNDGAIALLEWLAASLEVGESDAHRPVIENVVEFLRQPAKPDPAVAAAAAVMAAEEVVNADDHDDDDPCFGEYTAALDQLVCTRPLTAAGALATLDVVVARLDGHDWTNGISADAEPTPQQRLVDSVREFLADISERGIA